MRRPPGFPDRRFLEGVTTRVSVVRDGEVRESLPRPASPRTTLRRSPRAAEETPCRRSAGAARAPTSRHQQVALVQRSASPKPIDEGCGRTRSRYPRSAFEADKPRPASTKEESPPPPPPPPPPRLTDSSGRSDRRGPAGRRRESIKQTPRTWPSSPTSPSRTGARHARRARWPSYGALRGASRESSREPRRVEPLRGAGALHALSTCRRLLAEEERRRQPRRVWYKSPPTPLRSRRTHPSHAHVFDDKWRTPTRLRPARPTSRRRPRAVPRRRGPTERTGRTISSTSPTSPASATDGAYATSDDAPATGSPRSRSARQPTWPRVSPPPRRRAPSRLSPPVAPRAGARRRDWDHLLRLVVAAPVTSQDPPRPIPRPASRTWLRTSRRPRPPPPRLLYKLSRSHQASASRSSTCAAQTPRRLQPRPLLNRAPFAKAGSGPIALTPPARPSTRKPGAGTPRRAPHRGRRCA